jgi:very-short-patch-repair endonuclease
MGDCCCQCKAVKAKITNLENLGVEFPMQSKEVQNKSQQTCLKRYGVKHALQSQEIKEKTINTILKKYGVENIAKSQKCINKIKQTNLKRYGVEFACCNEEVRNKMRESLYKNGSCKTSVQQRKVYNMLSEIYGNCELNYPVSNCSLDCLIIVNDLKINIEYDGWYWHKDKQERDRRRDEFLKSQGYKILRIKAGRMIPTKEQLKNAIDYLVKGNHSYTEIILDI